MLTLALLGELAEKLKLLPKLSLAMDQQSTLMNKKSEFDNRLFYVVMLVLQVLAFIVLILGPSGLLKLIFGAPKAKKARAPFQSEKQDEDGVFDNLFRCWGARGGATTAAVAIALTFGLNLVMFFVRMLCMAKHVAIWGGRTPTDDQTKAYKSDYCSVITLQGQLNLLADSLLYIGVLIVWISLVVSGEMCGKAKRAEEDSAEAGDVEEGKKEGEYANFGAQNQAYPCGSYGSDQTASYPYPAAVPTTYPYNAAVSQPAYPAVCQPTVTAPY